MLEDKKVTYSYPLRCSTSLLIKQIILFQVSLLIVTLFSSVVLTSIGNISIFTTTFEVLNLIALFGFQVCNILVTVFMFLRWLHTIYLIKPDQIVEQRGILSIKEVIFMTEPVTEVIVTQSLVGRWLNYGTLRVINPMMRENLVMENIPHPYFYASVIEDRDKDAKAANIRYFPLKDIFKMEGMPRVSEV